MAPAPPAADSPSAATTSSTDSKLEVWKDMLYEKFQKAGDENELFTQYDLLDFDVIPNRDTVTLLKCLQSLTNDRLLIAVSSQTGLAWRWRSVEDAEKYKLCTTDEQRMVYGAIDEAGGDGIWSKSIQNRLNMHDSVLKTALKQLQGKGLIAPFKNVEHPNKRMFIKASMRPSERATGGPWFTDSTFDEAFIEEIQRVIFDYVKRKSTYHSTGSSSSSSTATRTAVPKKGVLKGGLPDAKGKKRSAGEMSGASEADTKPAPAVQPPKREPTCLPLPAGFKEYPTVREIARFISQSGITSDTILGEEDMQKLIDVLVFDGLIESIRVSGRVGYRVCRAPRQSNTAWAGRQDDEGGPEPFVNGYTEAPCGRCPVFELCEEGGPVSASNCVYFQRWLGLE
ncbi:RNA polymerase Rpc34 subunit [Colletotrichum scovillei]|uniref:DNA-directed RNA polymerase III subunit RPC6 n=1 Tax=Colletotrichum scovillei TaxID=1209932 RepID=A0A9P7QY66_9PEZI|nr:RNA polymerase Rpc34 subunit [Colletotrichum scovillei]KAF4784358.1 RNA polymerase Rpc34 subunit [Colletotrichum scovillei]KAG7044370.1 dna-directed rna polymerase iii subunit rpc6 [Colletotrichum scovillei]KAG7049080.1 dna-directed rna polymerase iii subunit rpc6 [Colletotrichum scovillei]KAG7063821.1 dna-directed rna polymerase iii subunit rpc6 [Colletotrichum scovillei]